MIVHSCSKLITSKQERRTLSVCLSVCHITHKVMNWFWLIFLSGARPKDQSIRPWWQPRSRTGFRVPGSESRVPGFGSRSILWYFFKKFYKRVFIYYCNSCRQPRIKHENRPQRLEPSDESFYWTYAKLSKNKKTLITAQLHGHDNINRQGTTDEHWTYVRETCRWTCRQNRHRMCCVHQLHSAPGHDNINIT